MTVWIDCVVKGTLGKSEKNHIDYQVIAQNRTKFFGNRTKFFANFSFFFCRRSNFTAQKQICNII
jgi:hypothetical protein